VSSSYLVAQARAEQYSTNDHAHSHCMEADQFLGCEIGRCLKSMSTLIAGAQFLVMLQHISARHRTALSWTIRKARVLTVMA